MNEIEHIRHSLAHLLAATVLQHYPDAQLTLGPAIDDGFYYDIHFPTTKPRDEDLPKLESTMREIFPSWHGFTGAVISADEARKLFAGNQYKLELIEGIIERGEEITVYTSGDFTDLCRGGHVTDMATIDPECFKLDKLAGAYWRGDEKNTMLTRIYGIAFSTKEELDQDTWRRSEAEKRDHRKLGRELKLFMVSDLVGSGLPLFHPKGLILREEIVSYLWELHRRKGYVKVWTPHIAKEALYVTSGHAGHYMEDMFKVHGGTSKEDFYLKPMNCPHHMQLFGDNQFSYRDMPVKYFEPATVYRDEKTGQLSGLSRVRSITQDDGHLFCRPNQIHTVCSEVVHIIIDFYTTMGMIGDYRVRLSQRDTTKLEDYIGSDEIWETAEDALTAVCKDMNLPYFEGPGEAAFYGPKLDFMFKDAIGREHQLATVQLDFNLPNRFDLSYVNENGEPERPVVIHRAISGSLERFLSVAIEHFAGAFPVWLSPVQVAILPISGDKHGEYAEMIFKQLQSENIRVEILRDETLSKRIRNAKNMRIPYQIVIGDSERDAGTITVEGRNELKLSAIQLSDFITRIQTEIRDRTDSVG